MNFTHASSDLRSLQQAMLTAIITKDLSSATEHITGQLDVYARAYEIRTLRRALATLEKAKIL
jgi:hypothetical protein